MSDNDISKLKSHYKNDIPNHTHTYGELHQANVRNLVELLMKLHVSKSKTYKGSWAARGHNGIFFTMVRPLDRIENIHGTVVSEGNFAHFFTRTFFDALVDTALYCLKWATLLTDMEPEILESWKKENEIE